MAGGIRLPDVGEGYWAPPEWQARGMRYAAAPLAAVLTDAGRAVAGRHPGARLGVCDLAGPGGGKIPQHRSHQSGRDVDILFLQRQAGRAVDGTAMETFAVAATLDPVPTTATSASGRQFDVARNWTLVQALVTTPAADVEWIFVAEPLAQLLLDHALAIGQPDYVVARAREVLRQPGDSAPHDDHFHVRVHCRPADITRGCDDSRAPKKSAPIAQLPLPAMVPWVARQQR